VKEKMKMAKARKKEGVLRKDFLIELKNL